jgi:alpha-tubulin suppressor-like RCC1 family protein
MYWITTDTTRMVACAAGEGHTVLLSASWHVFTVGDGSRGKLGHGNERSQLTPRRVEALMGLKIASVAAGHNHTLLITDTGLLYGCGANSHGQLGTGDRADQPSPVRLRHMDFTGGVAVVGAVCKLNPADP